MAGQELDRDTGSRMEREMSSTMRTWRALVMVPFALSLVGCVHRQGGHSALQSMPYDTRTPLELYSLVLNHYAARAGIRLLTVDDHTTTHCYDFSLPQWRGTLVDTLSIEATQAAADCAARSVAPLRIPLDSLQLVTRVYRQSDRRHPAPSIDTPLIFLSQAGLSEDGTFAMMAVGMFCGGGLCGSDDIYWFRSGPERWELYAVWNVGNS